MERGRGRGRSGGRGDARGGRGGGQRGGGRGGRGGGGNEIPQNLAVQQMAQCLERLSITSDLKQGQQDQSIVVRPGYGTAGRKVTLLSNHFRMTCSLEAVYQYDLAIAPKRMSKSGEEVVPSVKPENEVTYPPRLYKAIVAALASKPGFPPGWAFDGKKNIFTTEPISKSILNVPIAVSFEDEDSGRKRSFEATMKCTATIDMGGLDAYCKGKMAARAGYNAQDALKVLDIVFKHAASMDKECRISGRGIYVRHDPVKVGPMCEIWNGQSQSVRACQIGLLLNLDISAAAFTPPHPVLDIVEGIYHIKGPKQMQEHKFGPRDKEFGALKRALRNLKVEVGHLGPRKRKYRVRGVLAPASHLTFPFGEEKREVTVAQYFTSIGKPLRFPNALCLDCGTETHPRYLPMELCSIFPEKKLKVTGKETSEMVKVAAVAPGKRLQKTRELIQKIDMKCPRAFGISLDPQTVRIEARILPSPKLEYGASKCVDTGNKGAWNLLQTPFLKGSDLKSWAIVSLDERDRQYKGLDVFLQHLKRKLEFLGIKTAFPPPRCAYNRQRPPADHLRQGYQMAMKTFGMPPQLLLVIIPFKPADELYQQTKITSDSELGVASQCIVSGNAALDNDRADDNRRDQYLSNLAMKINAKLGGSICKIAGDPAKTIPVIGKEVFMLMGADVTHPRGREKSEPSVAGVVGSMNREASQYASETLVLGNRVEIIPVLDKAVEKLLLEFGKRNNRLPNVIVFYRDGIADNQFPECKQVEIPQIYKACERVKQGYRPRVTFVIVKKRHNARGYPIDENCDPKSGNILPGTCIDTAICHPIEFDFYLSSQAGIKGTSKPAHYFVLKDENKFGPDGLQLLTYWLCFLYCRCTRSVSYAPPAYYAHLAAARGKLLVHSATTDTDSVAGGEGGSARVHEVKEGLRSSMYYV